MRRFDPYSRSSQMLVDGFVYSAAFALAFLIRFEGLPDPARLRQMLVWLPFIVAGRVLTNALAGLYRRIWRFFCLQDVIVLSGSLFAFTLLLLTITVIRPRQNLYLDVWRLPLSVVALDFLLAFGGAAAARGLRRFLYEWRRRNTPVNSPSDKRRRVLLYGAGRAGLMLLDELRTHREVQVVGFIDDDRGKVGSVVSGVRILGNGDMLPRLVRQERVDEVVISIATASACALSRIANQCRSIPVKTTIVPSLYEVIAGRVSISRVRDVSISELLGRDVSVGCIDCTDGWAAYRGKRVLVTGGAGSIGSEVVRQLIPFAPSAIGILDVDENGVYDLEQQLLASESTVPLHMHIGNVAHRERVSAVFRDLRPQVIFHAAAHKHVPLMERNPCEAVLNNIGGTRTVLECAVSHHVERLVFISTDKAVNPTSVMGATKRAGERLVQLYGGDHVCMVCVRFGNVLASRGSVIPLFQAQIARGGPVTVTHPDVTRYFMTISEAVHLLLRAGSIGKGGETFVLEMGRPRRILDVAEHMIRLSGYAPGEDIPIVITGLRPGEKLYESLASEGEALFPTPYDKILAIKPGSFDEIRFRSDLDTVLSAAVRNDVGTTLDMLGGMGLGFTYSQNTKVCAAGA